MDMKGKIAIVTGGNTGIGRAIAERLASDGAILAICARRAELLESAAADIRNRGADVFQMTCDVQDVNQVNSFVQEIGDRFGQVDFLINNAGTSGWTPLSEPDDETWNQVIRTNLNGPYFLTSRVLPYMPEGGRIINISSVLGKFGVPGYAAYCTSKHGIIGFTRVAALELAERKITVNAICPGWVDTDLAELGMRRSAEKTDEPFEEHRKKLLSRVPLGEIIKPQEIAELVHFLLTPAAAMITGQAYNHCGGQVMH